MLTSFLLILFAMGLYGLVHSLLASQKAKELAAAWMGPMYSWYRLTYNIFAFISLLPVLALAVILPDKLIYDLPSLWVWPVTIIQLAGAYIAFVAARQTGLGYLAGLSQVMERTDQSSANRLETGGLYRYVRHPIYTGSIIFLWAAPQLTWNGLALRLAFTLYFLIGGMVEEKKLVAEFGDMYRAYRMRTPMIVPGLKKHL